MANRITKDELFSQAFEACKNTIELIDVYFLHYPNNPEDSLTHRVFKTDLDHPKESDEKIAKDAFRTTGIWENLDLLYNYAVEGILPQGWVPEDIVIGGAEALTLVSSENVGFSEGDAAFALVSAGDGRFALDNGESIDLIRLAHLANVDERTVRNAISAGELTGSGKPVYIENQSARAWLRNRRGYRPTQLPSNESASLADVKTPAQFGAFLKAQYERLYPGTERGSVMPMYSAMSKDTINALEAGVFKLPLDACSVLADFYQLERQLFLVKVMEVFYSNELYTLLKAAAEQQGVAS